MQNHGYAYALLVSPNGRANSGQTEITPRLVASFAGAQRCHANHTNTDEPPASSWDPL